MFERAKTQRETRAAIDERDDAASRRVDVRALNLDKIPGPTLEATLNEWAEKGYEPRFEAKGYVVLTRPV